MTTEFSKYWQRIPKWIPVVASILAIGSTVWAMSAWCTHVSDTLDALNKTVAIVSQQNQDFRKAYSGQQRQIDALQANQSLLMRSFRITPIPVPNTTTQDSNGQSFLDRDPQFSKATKPIPPVMALDN